MYSSKKIPRNVKLSLGFLHSTEKIIRDLFANILHDYCSRFNVEVTKNKVVVVIAGVSDYDDGSVGVTYEGNNRYLAHVYDPCLDQGEDTVSNHRLVTWSFITALCHEIVHVMQHLTGRKPEFETYPAKDSEDPEELYFFEPSEIEARILEGFYAAKFGVPLRNHSESE